MPFSILYVCTGNICRSPLAERLLRARLDAALGQRAKAFSITSAGTHGWDGAAMDRLAAAELARLGGDPAAFRSKLLTPQHIESSDLVLTATRAHRSFVLSDVPQALRRTFTMCEFADLVDGFSCDNETARGSTEALVAWAASRRGSARLDAYDIADPYGASGQAHTSVANQISACVDRTVAALGATALTTAG